MSSFANIAGRAAFVLGLDKSELDTGLPKADRQFDQATSSMEKSADRATAATNRTSTAIGSSGVGLVGRLGLIGIAANAGLQGLNAASKALEVTGAAAGTTEGRVRNLGAALSRGDVVGGLQALATQAQLSAEQLDGIVQSSAAAGSQAEIDGLKAKTASLGWGALTKQLNAASAAATAAAAQRALDFAARKENVVDTPTGTTTVGRGTSPDDRGGQRGVGATGPGATPTPQYKDPFAARQQRADTASLNTQLTKGLSDDLKAQREQAAIAKARVDAATKGTEQYRKLYAAYVQQQVAANAIQDQIDAAATQAAQERARKAAEAARRRKAIQDAAAREAARRAREERAEAARQAAIQYKLDAEASNQLRALLDKAVFKPGSDGSWVNTGPKSGAQGADPFGQMAQEFLRQLTGQAKAYASNVTVIQNFHANTPPFTAAREHRRAAEAAFG